MATVAVIQMVLLSVAMAQPNYGDNNLDGLWIHVLSPGSPFLPSSAPCLLRGRPVVKRDDYTYTPGVGAHKLHTRAAIWNEARITCEEEGGHLAIVNSIAEADAITEIFKNAEAITGSPHPDFASIGFHDLYSEGQFITIHGQTLAAAGFTLWASGQPDNAGGTEHCGSLHKSGRLNDINCGTEFGFICEIPILQSDIPQL